MNSPATQPILIEIMGVAGSGKSSLANALGDQGYGRPPFISTSDPQHLLVALRALPRLWSLILQNLLRSPRMTWADFKLMAYATGWRRFLERHTHLHDRAMVFDQGPLYALGRLEARGLGIASTPAFERWRSEMLTTWAEEMSLVVWLDAEDEQLLRRIDQRTQDHTIKGTSTDEGARFIRHYREVFVRLLDRIEELDTAEIVQFDTTNVQTLEIVRRVQEWVDTHSSQ